MRQRMHSAFTLVEVLTAMGIGLGIMAIALFAQQNMTTVTNQASSLASLYLQSNMIMAKVRDDFSYIQPNTAMRVSIDVSDPNKQQCIFMFNLARGGNAQDVNGGWDEDRRSHLLQWVVWDFDPAHGLRRGATADNLSGRIIDSFFSENTGQQFDARWDQLRETFAVARRPIPVREMKYFLNQGDFTDLAQTKPEAQLFPYLWFDENAGETYNDRYLPITHPTYELGNAGYLSTDITAKYYAAKLPPPNDGWDLRLDSNGDNIPEDANADGIPDSGYDNRRAYYTKDRYFVLGVPGDEENPYYPDRRDRVASNVELFEMEFERIDGSIIPIGDTDIDGFHMDANLYRPDDAGYAPIDPATSANLAAEINTVRTFIEAERQELIDARPRKVTLTYVIHDMPEQPGSPVIDADAELDTINYVRSEFYNTANVPVVDRSHELFKRMIERAGHTAIIIKQVVYFP